MAGTKIWAIKDSLSRVVGYAENPDKTEYRDVQIQYSDLTSALRYASNPEKTGNEKAYLVTALHCESDDPAEDMLSVQRRFGKTGGNVAYHAYQSFKPGEITPEQCHRIGVELAKRLWGDRFQVLVATHMNCHHLHNHFVINSVSYRDGKKYDCSMREYARFRAMSDELCRKYELSVVKNPGPKTSRGIYRAIQAGRETKYTMMREAVGKALRYAKTWDCFCHDLYDLGYEFEPNFDRKYSLIRRTGDVKWTRLYHLGYDLDYIGERIFENEMKGYLPYERRYAVIRMKNPTLLNDPFERTKIALDKVGLLFGVIALIIEICGGPDLLEEMAFGKAFEARPKEPLTPQMKEMKREFDLLNRQAALMRENHIRTFDDAYRFIERTESKMVELSAKRAAIYNRIRRADATDRFILKQAVYEISDEISVLRQQVRDTKNLLEKSGERVERLQNELDAIRRNLARTHDLSPQLAARWKKYLDDGYETPESLLRAYEVLDERREDSSRRNERDAR